MNTSKEHPSAPKRDHSITQHGITRNDPYFWMRHREDPEVLRYLSAESDYLEEVMQHTVPLQEKLFVEMVARIKEADVSAPERNGEYYYYTRTEAGKQYPVFCRSKERNGNAEEILLDQNKLAEGSTFCRIGAFSISPDAKKLAYSIDADGSENCTIYIKDLEKDILHAGVIQNTWGDVYTHRGVEWSADSQIFFYVTLDSAQRPYKLYRHVLGDDPVKDVLLFHEEDDTFFLYLEKTRSGAYIMTYHHATTTREMRFLPSDQPMGPFLPLQKRIHGVEYHATHQGDSFWITINENALNFKLMRTPTQHITKEHWQEVIPEREDTLLEEVQGFENHLVILERKNGLQHIRISAGDGISDVHYVPFPEPAYTITPEENPEYQSHFFRFIYTSLITPNSVIDYDMNAHEWLVQKEQEIPSGYDRNDFIAERIFATSADGTSVPLSIVYKKGTQKNGNNPCLLYSYGSYGYSTEPVFSSNRLSLLERGFVFAMGHIRGGSEMGRAWYDDGKMLNKRNTFADFIACAETLIAQGYTNSNKIAIQGGSAGGLLVGASMTMRPELFRAVIAKVPFVDIVNTMSDPSIPLTTLEYQQWGNPDDETYFHYLMSYSPYDNIRTTSYPNILITTGLNDPRVAYWEPAKFTARLRELKTDNNLLLLKTNFDAGHAGASGRYDYLKEIAFDYAFLMETLK